jgi:hypothetical protein
MTMVRKAATVSVDGLEFVLSDGTVDSMAGTYSATVVDVFAMIA